MLTLTDKTKGSGSLSSHPTITHCIFSPNSAPGDAWSAKPGYGLCELLDFSLPASAPSPSPPSPHVCGEELKCACAGQETQLYAGRATEAVTGAEAWGSITGTCCAWNYSSVAVEESARADRCSQASAPGDSNAGKRQTPAMMSWVPALPGGPDQQDLLAIGKDLFLIWKVLVAELLTASSLPMGLATLLTAATLPASIIHLGNDPGHPTSHMVWGDSCP